jgi:hypothetical protein
MHREKLAHKKHQWLFWLILAAISTFFAEVFSGSDMFPYFSAWGLLVVVPLYGLHIILLASLVHRADKPRFPSLVFAGMVFGLYEAYLTKVLWAPPWGNPVIIAEFAPVETLVLVTWWHCWFSFIIPLLVAEKLFTNSTSLGNCLPGKLGDFLNSWGGLAAVMVFGGLFQSINSPSPGHSLLSGISTTGVLVGLTVLWKWVTKDQDYTMKDLLPNRNQFKRLLIPVGIMYLVMGILVRPEAYPGLVGHLAIWILYGISFYLFFRSQKGVAPEEEEREVESWPTQKWLLLAGIFPLAAVSGEILFQGFFEPLALIFWFGGIVFGIWMVGKAVRLTIAKKRKDLSNNPTLSS